LVRACIYGCLCFVVGLLVLGLEGDSDRQVELLILRHELRVLRRSLKKPRLNSADRMILAALVYAVGATGMDRIAGLAGDGAAGASRFRAQAWSGSTSDRRGVQAAHPPTRAENPRWGYRRIRDELLKLGHVVSVTSIRNLMQKYDVPTSPRRSGLSWREFQRAQASANAIFDYLEIFHNRQRRHSSLGMLTSVEFEARRKPTTAA
jgi:hypothetical protein